MNVCATCGNEKEAGGRCPFCGAWQSVATAIRPKERRSVATVNLEQGLPLVEDALAKLDREIASARMRGVRLLRLIHGWGSSGSGGGIRAAVHERLASLLRSRKIRGFIPGDEYSEDTNRGRTLLTSYPSLRSSLRTDRENPGITFVEV